MYLVAELVCYPQASAAVLVRVGWQEPGQRLGEVTIVGDLADDRGRGGPPAHGGGWGAVFEGVAGDFGDGEHKVLTAVGGQSSSSSVPAFDLA